MTPIRQQLPLSEKQKMLTGEPYNSQDPELVRERIHARRLARLFNGTLENEKSQRQALLKQLFGELSADVFITPPFYCDYGYNIFIGKRFYANFDCAILDVCEVHIGDDCLLAPGVHIYTSAYPEAPELRAAKKESGKSVRIGNNVWIGGRAIILPGVSIGDNVVVAAGAVVAKDIPDNALVAGNPAEIRKDVARNGVL